MKINFIFFNFFIMGKLHKLDERTKLEIIQKALMEMALETLVLVRNVEEKNISITSISNNLTNSTCEKARFLLEIVMNG